MSTVVNAGVVVALALVVVNLGVTLHTRRILRRHDTTAGSTP